MNALERTEAQCSSDRLCSVRNWSSLISERALSHIFTQEWITTLSHDSHLFMTKTFYPTQPGTQDTSRSLPTLLHCSISCLQEAEGGDSSREGPTCPERERGRNVTTEHQSLPLNSLRRVCLLAEWDTHRTSGCPVTGARGIRMGGTFSQKSSRRASSRSHARSSMWVTSLTCLKQVVVQSPPPCNFVFVDMNLCCSSLS